MRTLLQRLEKFNLTKPEVLMMINLGVGVKRPGQNAVEMPSADEAEAVENGGGDLLDKVERHINSAEAADGSQVNGNAQTDLQTQERQEDNPDISVLNTIIEEMYERFKDAEINEILHICGEVLGSKQTDKDDVHMQD
jgi:hypothetical protein